MTNNYQKESIFALATPNGIGAIAVIRVSGIDAIELVNSIFIGKNLTKQTSHTIHFGKLQYKEELIDEVLVSIFYAPHSFTKENVVEIACHGSLYIQQRIMEILTLQGARPAKAGEFTQRAYLNGRFDLAQAEAIADVIASDSQAAHKIAMQQMRGGISSKLKELRNSLVEFTALIELELDFGEEDVEFADRTKLNELLHQIQKEISNLSSSFQYGNAIKNGIPVAIVGKPNAGKSTLLNALLEEERAIVSNIAGTTRDTIEETLTIDGYLFRFIDTAGLREAKDEIEKIGIERSKEAIAKADITLYISDYNEMRAEEVFSETVKLKLDKRKTILLANKIDIYDTSHLKEGGPAPFENYRAVLENFGFHSLIFTSFKEKDGIDKLKSMLVKMMMNDKIDHQNAVIVSNQRHYEALQKSQLAIDEVLQKLKQNISSDFISQDIKTALRHLGAITGEIDIDKDILGTIFGKFCIGK